MEAYTAVLDVKTDTGICQWLHYQPASLTRLSSSKCDLASSGNKPPKVKLCGTNHKGNGSNSEGSHCSTGDCCSKDGKCVSRYCSGWSSVSNLHRVPVKITVRAGARRCLATALPQPPQARPQLAAEPNMARRNAPTINVARSMAIVYDPISRSRVL